MTVDALSRLRYAIAATRHGGGAASVTAQVRQEGVDAFDIVIRSLTGEQTEAIEEMADQLHRRGTDALLLGDDGYPANLTTIRRPPPALFVSGPRHLLDRAGIGMCGSRNATNEGLRAARACAEAIASHELNVVSGYARGVDMAAHAGALTVGGATIIVLAEGIERFRVRSGEFSELWDSSRVVVMSQFSPAQPWNAGAAMTRNAVISGLSKALVVVEAGETGGTLAAGLHALDRGQPVMVLQLFGTPAGNQMLHNRGATIVHSRQELETYLDDLPTNGSIQLSII